MRVLIALAAALAVSSAFAQTYPNWAPVMKSTGAKVDN